MNTIISADLLATEPPNFRGCVDGFELESGILGWVINLDRPVEPVEVRFRVDGMVFLEVFTSISRPDINLALSSNNLRPGFCIPYAQLIRLKQLIQLRPDVKFEVEVGSTSLILPCENTVPSLKAILEHRGLWQADYGRGTAVLERLKDSKRDAQALTSLPLRPFEDLRLGFIEAVSVSDHDPSVIWVIGWCAEADLEECPVVLVDGRKYAGAITACRYPRDDLASGATGFVGVLYTDWRVRQMSQPIVYLGAAARYYLASIGALPKISSEAVLRYIEHHRTADNEPSWSDLHAMLAAHDPWSLRAAPNLDIQVGIDQVILIPGCGCVVSGWVISFAGEIRGFAIKVGSEVLFMDETSLITKPRPDLLSAFPDAAILTDRAGFVCFFAGQVDNKTVDTILLRVIIENGLTSIHPVANALVRRLGETVSRDTLLDFYPQIENEAFFPALTASVRADYIERRRSFNFIRFQMSREAIVFVVPPTQDEFFFAINEIRHKFSTYVPNHVGLVFVISEHQRHSNFINLLNELRADFSMSVSLVKIVDPFILLFILDDILLSNGTERFCVVAMNEVLTKEGWCAARSFFQNPDSRTILFVSTDPEYTSGSRSGIYSFASDRHMLRLIKQAMVVKIEDQVSLSSLATTLPKDAIMLVKSGTFFTQQTGPGPLARLINSQD